MSAETLELIVSQQLAHTINSLVHLIGGDGKPNAVLPDPPMTSIVFEGLFCACKRLFVLLLHSVAIRDVAPGFRLLLINGDYGAECEDSLV